MAHFAGPSWPKISGPLWPKIDSDKPPRDLKEFHGVVQIVAEQPGKQFAKYKDVALPTS
jgi:hypothetical protein